MRSLLRGTFLPDCLSIGFFFFLHFSSCPSIPFQRLDFPGPRNDQYLCTLCTFRVFYDFLSEYNIIEPGSRFLPIVKNTSTKIKKRPPPLKCTDWNRSIFGKDATHVTPTGACCLIEKLFPRRTNKMYIVVKLFFFTEIKTMYLNIITTNNLYGYDSCVFV